MQAPSQAGQLEVLNALADEFTEFGRTLPSDARTAFDATVFRMHRLCVAIDACYGYGVTRAEILLALTAVLDVCTRSPFVARLHSWPRGYPGDFETIDYIVEQRNRALPNTVEYYVEQYALGSAMRSNTETKFFGRAN